MDETLLLEIKKLPEYLQDEVKDFVRFLNNKLDNSIVEKSTVHKTRRAGFLKGTFKIAANFDEPLEDFKEYM